MKNEPEKGTGTVSLVCAPSLVPAATADQGALLSEIALLFEGYESSAEDASTLMLKGGGTLISLMSAKQTQKMAVYLIDRAIERVVMTAFTFDLIVVTDALRRAAARKVGVLLFVDRNQVVSGCTQFMVERMKELKLAGVTVYVTRGHPIRGSSTARRCWPTDSLSSALATGPRAAGATTKLPCCWR